MGAPIDLDGFATLPLAAEARDAMLSAWDQPGNAGSPNAAGERAASIVEEGRAAIAQLIGAALSEIVFTSGATEANNLAIIGMVAASIASGSPRRRVVVSAIEHKAVLEAAASLKMRGIEILIAPVDAAGRLDLSAYDVLVDDGVLIASVIMVRASNQAEVVLAAVGDTPFAVVCRRQPGEGVPAADAAERGHCLIDMPPRRALYARASDGLVEMHSGEIGDRINERWVRFGLRCRVNFFQEHCGSVGLWERGYNLNTL